MIGISLAIVGIAGVFSSLILDNDVKLIVSLICLGLGVAAGMIEFGIDFPMRAW